MDTKNILLDKLCELLQRREYLLTVVNDIRINDFTIIKLLNDGKSTTVVDRRIMNATRDFILTEYSEELQLLQKKIIELMHDMIFNNKTTVQ